MLVLTEIYYPSIPDFACSWITGCFRKYKVLSDGGFLAVSLAPVVCFLTYRFVQPLVSSILPMQQQGFWRGERTTASPGDKHIPLACGVWKLSPVVTAIFQGTTTENTVGRREDRPRAALSHCWFCLSGAKNQVTLNHRNTDLGVVKHTLFHFCNS